MWRMMFRMKRAGKCHQTDNRKNNPYLSETSIFYNILLCSSQVISVLKDDV